MDIRIIETIIIIPTFFILRIILVKFLERVSIKYGYNKYRIRPILKLINLFFFIVLLTIIIGVWGIEQASLLTFLSSVVAIIGVALVAQWSILSNITASLIIFMSHPIKLGESITILDKEFNVEGRVSDVGLFYVIVKTSSNEKIMIPNNLFLQKITMLRHAKQNEIDSNRKDGNN